MYFEQNPIRVLLLIRNGIVKDWKSLCKYCNISGQSTPGTILWELLKEFNDLGLIELIGLKDKFYPDKDKNVKIKPTNNILRIQKVFGISITELAESDPLQRLLISPIFGQPDNSNNENFTNIFVLMPLKEKYKPVYDDHLKKVAQQLNLTISRSDDFFTAKQIVSDIWEAIYFSKLIIADCSERNPNVFYEIGISHAIGKNVILITQDQKDIPFDLKHLRHFEYEMTPRGMKYFEDSLKRVISNELFQENKIMKTTNRNLDRDDNSKESLGVIINRKKAENQVKNFEIIRNKNSSIEEKVKSIIAEQIGIDKESIDIEGSFLDLEADSLDVCEIIMSIESVFNIAIPDEIAEGFNTIKDIINFLIIKTKISQ